MIKKNAVKCLECGKELESTHRHDFKVCNCPNGAFCDGGTDYRRIGARSFEKLMIWDDDKNEFIPMIFKNKVNS
jgi:hypothetical protein